MKKLEKPIIHRLQQIGELEVGEVFGNRILVECFTPKTEIDGVESRSGLYIPDSIKKDHTPLASTGIILKCSPSAQTAGMEEGMAVAFHHYSGYDVGGIRTETGKQIRIFDVSEILCSLIPEDKDKPLAATVVPVK